MKIKEILREKAGTHNGYMFSTIAESLLTHQDIKEMGYRELRIIPNKISSYLCRDKITKVYKSDCFRYPNNYYLVEATDGTIFHLE